MTAEYAARQSKRSSRSEHRRTQGVASRDKEATKQRLRNAAVELFVERGLAGSTAQEIAKRAGCTTGAIYRHYESKEDLLSEAIWAVAEAEVGAILRGDGSTPTLRVFAGMASWLQERNEPRAHGLLVESFAAARREPELADRLRARIVGKSQELQRAFAEMVEIGEISRAWDGEALAWMCQCLALGASMLHEIDAPPPSKRKWKSLMGQFIGSWKSAQVPAA